MDGCVDGWMDGCVDGWMGAWVCGWMDGWVDGWMGAWVDGWVRRRERGQDVEEEKEEGKGSTDVDRLLQASVLSGVVCVLGRWGAA